MNDRVLYAVPSGGHPHPSFVVSAHATISGSQRCRDTAAYGFITGQPVQMARTQAAMKCLSLDYDWLVMHDDDLELVVDGVAGNPLDAFLAVAECDPTIGIVGAVYLREKPLCPPINCYSRDGGDVRAMLVGGMPHAPFLVESVATGFVLIRAALLRQLYEQGDGPLFRFPVRRNRWGMIEELGEDVDFSQRAWSLGWKVVADPRIPTIHYKASGPLRFEWNKWEAQDQVSIDVGPGMKVAKLPCWALDTEKPPHHPDQWVQQLKTLMAVDVTPARITEADAWKRRFAREPQAPLVATQGHVLETIPRAS